MLVGCPVHGGLQPVCMICGHDGNEVGSHLTPELGARCPECEAVSVKHHQGGKGWYGYECLRCGCQWQTLGGVKVLTEGYKLPVAVIRPESTMALAHLLACLDRAVKELDACGDDVDARVVEAHRAALTRGAEWPGMPVAEWIGPEGHRSPSNEPPGPDAGQGASGPPAAA